uniref:Uncharacterized protein n=1 Tax=Aegilops tauschii subsp. strangulata TaxID=200361 RepID=A0A453HX96_AEGTS
MIRWVFFYMLTIDAKDCSSFSTTTFGYSDCKLLCISTIIILLLSFVLM